MLVLNSPPDAPGAELAELYRRRTEEGLIMHGPVSRAEYPVHPEFREEWQALTINAIKDGVEEYRFADRTVRVDTDTYIILGEESRYSYKLKPDGVAYPLSIAFPGHMASQLAADMCKSDKALLDDPDSGYIGMCVGFAEHLWPHDKEVTPQLSALARACLSNVQDDDWYQERLQILLQTILMRHRRYAKRVHGLPARKASTRSELARRLAMTTDYINENYSDSKLAIADMAVVACMSQYHFLRLCRELYVLTPHEYLQAKRCTVASRLLTDTGDDIESIARQVGFNNRVSMYRRFKKTTGVSPQKYRMINVSKQFL